MEIWKDVVGYEGLYQVSNMGNVKSLDRKVRCLGGYAFKKGKILRQSKNKCGYYQVVFSYEGLIKAYRVNRLIAIIFLDNPENKPQVNHKNGIRGDNRAENLEWCTISENVVHKFDVLGYKNNFQTNHFNKGKFGKLHHGAKKVSQYDLDGNFIKTWDSIIDIERNLLIKHSNISACCRGKRNHTGGFKWEYKKD